MSGLFAGLLLRQRGYDVDVYERVDSELAGRGAGIVAQPPVLTALRALGIDAAGLGVNMTTRRVLDSDGRIECEIERPQTLTAWERLYRLLRDAFPPAHYHRGVGLRGFSQGGDSVTVHWSDGTSREADILVGADGIRSTVRAQLLPGLTPLYAGYVAWRALLAESAIPPAIHGELFEFMTFCLPPGEQFLGYPVAGPDNDLRPGHRRYNVVWYRPADEADELRSLLTD
jgi:2-polyprenyl-6-methoxyphenol hydroxylase-like FAD-dependent oxidoreductase